MSLTWHTEKEFFYRDLYYLLDQNGDRDDDLQMAESLLDTHPHVASDRGIYLRVLRLNSLPLAKRLLEIYPSHKWEAPDIAWLYRQRCAVEMCHFLLERESRNPYDICIPDGPDFDWTWRYGPSKFYTRNLAICSAYHTYYMRLAFLNILPCCLQDIIIEFIYPLPHQVYSFMSKVSEPLKDKLCLMKEALGQQRTKIANRICSLGNQPVACDKINRLVFGLCAMAEQKGGIDNVFGPVTANLIREVCEATHFLDLVPSVKAIHEKREEPQNVFSRRINYPLVFTYTTDLDLPLAFLSACSEGRLVDAKCLVSRGLVKQPYAISEETCGKSGFLLAAEKGHLPIIKWHIEAGHARTPFDRCAKLRRGALYYACLNEHYEVVEYLLTHVTKLCASDYTPTLVLLASAGRTKLVVSLLKKDKPCAAKGLEAAILNEHFEIALLLLPLCSEKQKEKLFPLTKRNVHHLLIPKIFSDEKRQEFYSELVQSFLK